MKFSLRVSVAFDLDIYTLQENFELKYIRRKIQREINKSASGILFASDNRKLKQSLERKKISEGGY